MPAIRPLAHDRGALSGSVDSAAEQMVRLWARAEDVAQGQVSPSQLRALQAVGAHGLLNLNGLAAQLGAIPSSASRLCDRLVAAGLLDRRVSDHNRREVVLTLRPDGKRLLAEIERHRHATLTDVLGAMTQGGRTALLRGLEEFSRVAREIDKSSQHSA